MPQSKTEIDFYQPSIQILFFVVETAVNILEGNVSILAEEERKKSQLFSKKIYLKKN